MHKLRGLTTVVLLRILSWLPFSVLQTLGNLLGSLFYVLRSRNRRTIESNLLYCFPHWPARQRHAVTRRTLKESAKNALEIGAIWYWPSDRTIALIREVHGQHLLDAALAKKRGVIVLAPHLGNWEVVGLFLAHVARVTSLYAPAKIPALDKLIYKGRTQNGAHLVPTNASGVKALFKALRAGEMVGILPDQVPEEGSGVFAPFFGQPALTMTLVISLLQRTGAEVLCCYAKRRIDGKGFDICLLPAVDALKDASDEVAAATAMNVSIERCVSNCFEQYQWGYKRFREREGSATSLYLKDRRLQYRRRMGVSVAIVYESGAESETGRLLNLTPGGLMLSTRRLLSAGDSYKVCLSLPGKRDASITAEVKCLWSRTANEPGDYYSGMLITYMAQQEGVRLLEWLELYEQQPWSVRWAWPLLEMWARFPLWVATKAGYYLGSAEHWLGTRQRRYTEMNIHRAFPEWAGREPRVRESLQHYGMTLLGRPFVRLASAQRVDHAVPISWRPTTSLEKFRSVMRQQQGAVLLVFNIGYWEILLREIARQAALTLFYQPPLMDIRDRMVYRAALRDRYAVLSMQEGFADTALRIVEQGGIVALLPDQILLRDKARLAPFFGHEIPTLDVSSFTTASANIFCACITRQAHGTGYEIILEDVSEWITAEDAQARAVALNQCLERLIHDSPQQYHWHGRLFPK